MSLCLYRIKTIRVRTKECVKYLRYRSFLVGDTFDQVNELCEKVKSRIYGLRGCDYAISVISSATDYDADDRKYVCKNEFYN